MLSMTSSNRLNAVSFYGAIKMGFVVQCSANVAMLFNTSNYFPFRRSLYISLLYSENNARFLDTAIFPYLRLQNFVIVQFCESKFTTIKSLFYIQLFEEYTEAFLLFLFPQCEMLLLIKKEKSQRRGGQSLKLCSVAASWPKYN